MSEVHIAQDCGHCWHNPDKLKYCAGHTGRHPELYNAPVKQDKQVVEVFVQVLHGGVQYTHVWLGIST